MGKLILLTLFVLVGCAGREPVAVPTPAPKMVVNKIDGQKIKTLKDVADVIEAMNLSVVYPEGGESEAKKTSDKLKRLFK